MPAAYAHRRFGDEVLKRLPRELRENILRCRELYDIGLHGPDILFYHDPFLPGGLCRTGRALHYRSGLSFFKGAYTVLERSGFSPLYESCLIGTLCHFALDCMCHGTVRKHPELGHFELETELDRTLLLKDGHDPFNYSICGNLIPSMRNCAVTAAFYPGAKAADVRLAIRSMTFFTDLLHTDSKAKRRALLTVLRASGRGFEGLVLRPEANPKAIEPVRRLGELMKQALPLALTLIRDYRDTMSGKLPPDSHYQLNFESDLCETFK